MLHSIRISTDFSGNAVKLVFYPAEISKNAGQHFLLLQVIESVAGNTMHTRQYL
jgi:hypothetical protein